MMASPAASMRVAVTASISEMRAPVIVIVRQKDETEWLSCDAARTNASRSQATRYFRLPPLSNRLCVMRQLLARYTRKIEALRLTRERACEQNTAFCSLIVRVGRFV